jgi:hypothetical protein
MLQGVEARDVQPDQTLDRLHHQKLARFEALRQPIVAARARPVDVSSGKEASSSRRRCR